LRIGPDWRALARLFGLRETAKTTLAPVSGLQSPVGKIPFPGNRDCTEQSVIIDGPCLSACTMADPLAKVAILDAQAAGPRACCRLNQSISVILCWQAPACPPLLGRIALVDTKALGLECPTRRVIPTASDITVSRRHERICRKRSVWRHLVFGCRPGRRLVKFGICTRH
jgi:hypothetical protein